MPTRMNPSTDRMRRHWRVLCDEIGNRLCGTTGEQRAADYIEQRMRSYGLDAVHQHRFDFPNSTCRKHELKVRSGGRWRRVANTGPFAYSNSTPADGVSGPLAYLQDGSEVNFKQNLRGKIGLLVGSLSLFDEKLKARLRRAKVKALLTVDARVPYRWPLAAGAAPQWIENFQIPTICVPFLEAVDLIRQMPLEARVTVNARVMPGRSQNVVGEITGSKHPDQVVIVSGHHDCVWGNTGADDNGSGVVFTLELAKLLAGTCPRRTLRFISYGVEERLSVGSYLYAQSLSASQRKQIVFALNADGIGDHMGPDELRVTGTPGLEKLAGEHWRRCGHPANVLREVTPFSDQFPINVCGAPSIFLGRAGMMWKLHSTHDNFEHVDLDVMRRTITTSAKFLQRIANAPRLPFPRSLAPDIAREVRSIAKYYFHHPWSPDTFPYDRFH